MVPWIITAIIALITAFLGYWLGKRQCARTHTRGVTSSTALLGSVSSDLNRLSDENKALKEQNAQLAADLSACQCNANANITAVTDGDASALEKTPTATSGATSETTSAASTSEVSASEDAGVSTATSGKASTSAPISGFASTGMSTAAPSPTATANQSTAPKQPSTPSNTTTDNFDADAAKQALGKRVKADDLTIIEGIGPKISQLFIAAGIDTWAKLSQASVEECQTILIAAGDRYKMHDPGTWPRQAKYASEGDWAGLVAWQDTLEGGRETQ